MKNIFLAFTLLFSMNAMAIDLSQDQVNNPVADATEITAAIAARGAVAITPVQCKQTGTADSLVVKCSTTRQVVYPEQDVRNEGFGCWFEYEANKAGAAAYTRTVWECPIL